MGIILHFLSRITNNFLYNIFGPVFCKIWTGWLGIPVHELGHVFFCIIFGHRINKILLYSFNPDEIEHIRHSYNYENAFQNIGNFFIGIGPLIFGSIIIYMTAYFLNPDVKEFFKMPLSLLMAVESNNLSTQLTAFCVIALNIFKSTFISTDKTSLLFWIFIYISLCISSWMGLSIPDIKSGWYGFRFIIISLFILNFFTILFNIGIDHEFSLFVKYLTVLPPIFIFAIILSAFNFLLIFIIISIYSIIKFKTIPNPFKYF